MERKDVPWAAAVFTMLFVVYSLALLGSYRNGGIAGLIATASVPVAFFVIWLAFRAILLRIYFRGR